ncbi:phosphoglycolate phosphatase [Glacieibacterium sp.]|uniref:phosphoglycolate phosphatase n=1 Tax=Glacieibacterium sp. TaxID=2860237 RepID=UPI003AFFE6B4
MKLPKLVIFDLDGTLVDSSPDLCGALNHTLAELGRPAVDLATVRHLVGHGARVLIERGLAHTGGGTSEDVDRGLPLFLAYYAAHIADGTVVFPGVEASLDQLTAAGVRVAICTNKPYTLSVALIEALGWQQRFDAILGADSVPARKPDPGHVVATAEAVGIPVDQAIFVGDTSVDVAAARAAGIPVIAVSFGFSDGPATGLGADLVIDHYDKLLPALASLSK